MQASRPSPRLIAGCLAVVAAIYVALSLGLGSIARWAESRFETYPYLAGEDPIRLLLPTVHGTSDRGALLLGPSAIGEDFLYEELERRWGMTVRSGSLSMGTVDDFYLFLSYVERVYGQQALPKRVVLGIKPRVLANLPRLFGPKSNPKAVVFTISLIDRYSTHLRVQRGELGTDLVEKSLPESVVAWLRFYLTKQQPRHRAGVLAVLEHAIDPDPLKIGFQDDLPRFAENPRLAFSRPNIKTTLAWVRDAGPVQAGLAWARAYRSAYNNMFSTPMPDEEIREVVARDEMGFGWNPREEEAMLSMQLGRLASLAERNGIELVVAYLPVHSAVRAGYDPVNFEAYETMIEERLPNARFVDLWGAVSDDLFFDEVHLQYEGARQATELLVEALERPEN